MMPIVHLALDVSAHLLMHASEEGAYRHSGPPSHEYHLENQTCRMCSVCQVYRLTATTASHAGRKAGITAMPMRQTAAAMKHTNGLKVSCAIHASRKGQWWSKPTLSLLVSSFMLRPRTMRRSADLHVPQSRQCRVRVLRNDPAQSSR